MELVLNLRMEHITGQSLLQLKGFALEGKPIYGCSIGQYKKN